MNGRSVFNFAAKVIPAHTQQTLQKNNLTVDQMDQFILRDPNHSGYLMTYKSQ
jgi:3-oxoacyl-[acyl-carrier-protein] synthase III